MNHKERVKQHMGERLRLAENRSERLPGGVGVWRNWKVANFTRMKCGWRAGLPGEAKAEQRCRGGRVAFLNHRMGLALGQG